MADPERRIALLIDADNAPAAKIDVILAEVARHIGASVDLLGHSMGGKAAMQLALTEPALIRRMGSLTDALFSKTAAERAALTSAGLAEFYDGDPAQGMPAEAWPLWSIILRYHWTQTFPAGQTVAVSHSYDNRSPGGLFGWTHPASDDYNLATQAQYCIDDSTSRALEKRLRVTDDSGNSYSLGTAHFIAYVLRTANSWAGPIQRFRLTLDKGAPGNVISLCADGVKKTGPTTFVVEKTDYSPAADLHVLIAAPFPPPG